MASVTLEYLLAFWGAITAVLIGLVIYGNALSTREDDELYLNQTEEEMMGAEQKALIRRMDHLAKVIAGLAVLSVILLATSAGVWIWQGLYGS